jgi:hypothetical protein
MIMNVESGQWVGIYDKSDSAESEDRDTKSVAFVDFLLKRKMQSLRT